MEDFLPDIDQCLFCSSLQRDLRHGLSADLYVGVGENMAEVPVRDEGAVRHLILSPESDLGTGLPRAVATAGRAKKEDPQQEQVQAFVWSVFRRRYASVWRMSW